MLLNLLFSSKVSTFQLFFLLEREAARAKARAQAQAEAKKAVEAERKLAQQKLLEGNER